MFKFLWVIVLGLLPLSAWAEVVEEKTIKMWESQLNVCRTYQLETDEHIKSYTDEDIREVQETIAANNVCYKIVFREILQKYYGFDRQTAHFISDYILDGLEEEYFIIYSENKYGQSDCDKFLSVKPKGWASLDFRNYLSEIILFLKMSEKKESYIQFAINKSMNALDLSVFDFFEKDYVKKECLADDESCWESKQDILIRIQKSFLAYLASLFDFYYDESKENVAKLSQQLWDNIYARYSILFNHGVYADKTFSWQKTLNIKTVALTELVNHIKRIEEIVKTHGSAKNTNDKFVNPVFYGITDAPGRIMLGISMFLTPTSIECYERTYPKDCYSDDCVQFDRSVNRCERGDCRLIDQTEQRVLFRCVDNPYVTSDQKTEYIIFDIDMYEKYHNNYDDADYPTHMYWSFDEALTIDYTPPETGANVIDMTIHIPKK